LDSDAFTARRIQEILNAIAVFYVKELSLTPQKTSTLGKKSGKRMGKYLSNWPPALHKEERRGYFALTEKPWREGSFYLA
jgi:hypothetical protein